MKEILFIKIYFVTQNKIKNKEIVEGKNKKSQIKNFAYSEI